MMMLLTINDLLGMMGKGMRLRVPHLHDGTAAIVEGLEHQKRESIPIALEAANELIETGMICKLTEDRDGQRIGWKESGYDGDVADWYVCVQ